MQSLRASIFNSSSHQPLLAAQAAVGNAVARVPAVDARVLRLHPDHSSVEELRMHNVQQQAFFDPAMMTGLHMAGARGGRAPAEVPGKAVA